MEFTKFKEILDLLIEQSANTTAAYRLKIDLIDYCDPYNECIALLWSEILTNDGLEWLNWFLYDKGFITGELDPEIKAYQITNGDEKVEIIRDLPELYDYLIQNKYFKCINSK